MEESSVGVPGNSMFRLVDYLMMLFAAWTLAANIAYVLGQSLAGALALFALFAPALLVILWRADRGDGSLVRTVRSSPPYIKYLSFVALIALLAAVIFESLLLAWLGALGIVLWVLAANIWSPENEQPAGSSSEPGSPLLSGRRVTIFLIMMCLVGIAASLFTNRPDSDDTAYLNLAVTVANAPTDPIPHDYPLFPEDVGYPSALFPLMSFLHGIGLASWLTGLEVLPVVAFMIAPFSAALMVLGYAMLFRTLDSTNWPWYLVTLVAILLIEGSAHRIFPNFAFVRSWQGKSLLLHGLLPLAYTYGLRFGRDGYRRDWLLLAASQVAMIGASPIAIWMGPLAALVSVVTGLLISQRRSIRKLVLGGLTSFYPVIIGLAVFSALRSSVVPADLIAGFDQVESILMNFGNLDRALIWLGLLLMATIAAPTRPLRVFLGVGGLIGFGILLNPVTAEFVARNVTSVRVYWRVIWMLALPLAGAVALSLPALRIGNHLPGRVIILVATIALYALLVPGIYVLSSDNSVSIGPPGLKVNRGAYAIARQVTDQLDEKRVVIASQPVSTVMSTLQDYLYPVAPKQNQLRNVILRDLGQEEYQLRRYLLDYADGKAEFKEGSFEQALVKWDVGAVVVVSKARGLDELGNFLVEKGFTPGGSMGNHHLWIRN